MSRFSKVCRWSTSHSLFQRRSSKRRRERFLRPLLERLERREVFSGDSPMEFVGPRELEVTMLDSPAGEVVLNEAAYHPSRMLVRYEPGAAVLSAAGEEPTVFLGSIPGLVLETLADQTNVTVALEECQTRPGVQYCEPDFQVTLADLAGPTLLPNDPRFGDLWGLHNTGQNGGKVDADIDAAEAWDIAPGSRQTVIAVIDTGIDYNHPDLQPNIWVNADEIPGNGRDDDNNGVIDDVHGFNAITGSGDPRDDHSHGTHVAGTIGGLVNNGLGVAGVMKNVSLMAVKFLSSGGSGYISDALKGLDYAVQNGAAASNNSWGGGGFSQAFADGLQRAAQAGHIFVAAAGNSNNDNDRSPFYPATYPHDNVIAVAASDRHDDKAGFSSYGATTVDIAAPGVDIVSTVLNGGYASYSGTSMASPHAAAVVGLVRSEHPEWSYQQVIDTVLTTGDPVAAFAGKTVTGKRVNALQAVNSAPPVLPELTMNNAALIEGDSGQQFLNLDVTLSAASTTQISFDFASGFGNATPGEDYVAVAGRGFIPAGQTSIVLPVPIIGDTTQEETEYFFIDLSNAQGATIKIGRGQGVIYDNDQAAGRRVGLCTCGQSPGGDVFDSMFIDNAEGVQSVDVTIRYGTGLLDVSAADVRLGDLTSGWQLAANVDDATGTITASLFGTTPLPAGARGRLLDLTYHVRPDATEGTVSPLHFETLKLNEGQIASRGEDGSISVTPGRFRVTNHWIDPNAVQVIFSQPFQTDLLNLYRGQTAGGAPDVTVVGDVVGPVAGGIVLEWSAQSLRFVRTGSPFIPDTYTIRIAGRSDSLVSLKGDILDGDNDGQPGGEFVTRLTILPTTARVMSMPDVARGPGQAVNLPATAEGIPLRISDASDVRSVDFELHFDPSAINVTGAKLAANVPDDWQIAWNLIAPGRLKVLAFGAQGLPAGARDLVRLLADVPTAATLGASRSLRFDALRLNEGAIPAVADEAVQVVMFLGDTTGNGGYSGLDASLIARVAVGLDSGFDGSLLVDPVIVADVTGDGTLSGLDAAVVAGKAAGKPQPEIPDLLNNDSGEVGVAGVAESEPVATLQLSDVRIDLDGNLLIDVNLECPLPILSADVKLAFDAARYAPAETDVNVSAAGLAAGWTHASRVDLAAGLIDISLYGATPLSGDVRLATIRLLPLVETAEARTVGQGVDLTLLSDSRLDEGRIAVLSVTTLPPKNSHDVNGDGFVSPLDALLLINLLNAHEQATDAALAEWDVSGDGWISPLDVLQIVNYLHAATVESGR